MYVLYDMIFTSNLHRPAGFDNKSNLVQLRRTKIIYLTTFVFVKFLFFFFKLKTSQILIEWCKFGVKSIIIYEQTQPNSRCVFYNIIWIMDPFKINAYYNTHLKLLRYV